MATDVTMPQLGESVTEGTITRWLKKPGDRIAKYEPLCEVATDKVNAEVPATISGTLLEIVAEEGATVEVGQLICRIEEEGSTPSPQPENQGKDSAASSAAAPAGQGDQSMKRRYSPAVLRLAQEHGIDLEKIEGTGRGGRITRKDVLRYIESGKAGASPSADSERIGKKPAAPAGKPAAPEIRVPVAELPAKEGLSVPLEEGDRVVPVTSVRRTIAQRMVTSKHEAPHAWTMVEADVTGLVQLRERLKKEFKEREGISLTYLPFFIKAVVDSLKEFPYLNSVWAGDRIILKKRINISIAVATDDALYVPVIHDADEKSIAGLAKAVHRLAEKTRAGKLTLEDMQGGTFTVNNTGSFGSILSQPIINHPQAAILSVESIVKRPVIKDSMIAIRDMVNLCLSLDHRVLDGLMAGRFLQRVKERVEAYGPDTQI
ncbi:2-oxoisovalerate dehydrogenase E2 component (dihydrolipoyl transacylase) [Planifilum fulgidum]|jgi:2-oxoisovalerate dehydrogenase E2 component (dihydrolipoyl transacylase)|uniref:Dihydrolipoamide acetyltransferase component of pyruvate dehydrogenase complex n=1 Tax=Planifilum fulgidum TaxID=201973 RepID=A0A1I2LA60_9BACL|nr:dihydrolipoamide acetyltransferase family protein [Planifilum fulgidum]MBO2495800.1 2-oxo acid dehydrogenase subunit E2 [Bacillota bacterium]SFF74081.1 2-oxoisovalerate dehydrogenase E2 component (dihydrolipoyl transacylase) [Planifilum fulgidum]